LCLTAALQSASFMARLRSTSRMTMLASCVSSVVLSALNSLAFRSRIHLQFTANNLSIPVNFILLSIGQRYGVGCGAWHHDNTGISQCPGIDCCLSGCHSTSAGGPRYSCRLHRTRIHRPGQPNSGCRCARVGTPRVRASRATQHCFVLTVCPAVSQCVQLQAT
jgi:hypothetical protein